MPNKREDRRVGAAVSLLLHALLVLLIATPIVARSEIKEMLQGAGGKGPAGGGGGGRRGTGGETRPVAEQLRFAVVSPPSPKPVVQPPVVVPPPKPVPTPPQEMKPEVIAPALTPPSPMKPLVVGVIPGAGGGSGSDGSNGSGPGRGGGVGSGVGPGRGSGNGPGTGGGTQANYPPAPTEMFLPPYPIPNDVKGFHLVAEFDVDETGRVLSMQFTETKNRAYNRRLEEVFRAFKFRPGTRPDGTPLRMKAQIALDLY